MQQPCTPLPSHTAHLLVRLLQRALLLLQLRQRLFGLCCRALRAVGRALQRLVALAQLSGARLGRRQRVAQLLVAPLRRLPDLIRRLRGRGSKVFDLLA